MARTTWLQMVAEPAALAIDSLRTERARSALAIAGIVIGIVTVVLVASVLANVRNQVALLFRDLGTDNVFAFHLTGDPYVTPNEKEARRKPLKLSFVRDIARLGTAIRDVGAQVIVPTVSNGQVLVARARGNESDTVLVEGASPALFDIIGAEFAAGRPFTELEDREGAHVAVVGANLAKALFGSASPLGQTLTLAGDSYVVVGELAKRRGGFFGENRQDNVLNLPAGTVRNRFGEPERVVLYMRAKPGQRAACFAQAEAILRLLRKLPPTAENDFTLSTADQIIATFDGLSARIGLATVGLAGVSLLIGAIGIANVMFISVTERTRRSGCGSPSAPAPGSAGPVSDGGGVSVGDRRRRRRRGRARHRTAAHPGHLGLFSGRAAVGDYRGACGFAWRRHRRRLLASAEGRGPRIRSKRCGMNNTSWRLRAAKAVRKVGM